MDLNAAFKITAGVAGQHSLDALNKSVGQINTGIGKLPGLAKMAGMAIVGLGSGLAFATFKEKFDGVVESILQVKDAAEKTGSSVEKIGGLVTASKITGDDWGTIEGAIIKMDKALAGADDTAKGAAHALSAIGLNIQQLRQMDPADAFTAIAQALAGFEDGAGKTALAMDLFGKSGAQVLPFLKDYAELGEQVSRVTQQQAEDAEAYQRATLRLNAAKQTLYKTISTQLLPVATDFVQALLDVTNGTNGVKGAAQGLAADGSMTAVFREGARAAAALMDVIALLIKGVAQLGESFGVVWNDAKTLGKVMAGGIGGAFTEEGRAYIAQAIADRDAYMAKVEKDFNARWNGSITPYTDALEKRFAQRDQGAGAGRGSAQDPRATNAPRSLTGYTSRAPSEPKGGGGADPYASELNSLGREAAKLAWQTQHIQQYAEKIDSAKAAQIAFDIEQGKFKDLSAAQKSALLAAAEAVDRNAEALRQAKVGLEFENQTKAIDANTASLGLNSQERELAAASQELENKGVKQGTELYEKLMASRRAALERKADANAGPLLGLKQGINEVGEQVNNVAGNVKNAFVNAFNGAADALTDFVMTGKLNFGDFARSVIKDLTNMLIKQAMFNALKAGLGGTSFGAMLGFANGGAFSGGVQAFATGGVVGSPTLFKFASGGQVKTGLMGEAGPEAIMPLRRGRDGRLGVAAAGGGGGGNVTIGSINVQADGTTAANDSSGQNAAALGRQLSSAIQAEILKQKRPGGLLAAA